MNTEKSKGPEKSRSLMTDRLLAIHLRADSRIERTITQQTDMSGGKR